MPVTMGGMASGMDTDSIIQKLVDVESRPLVQMEQAKYLSNQKKDALGKLRTYLTELETASKNLYGLQSSYDDKKAFSSDPSIIDGMATKRAEKGIRHVRVLSLASVHKLASDPVKGGDTLPGGVFKVEVNGESHTVRFKGGLIRNLRDQFESECQDILSASLVNTQADENVMTLESKVSGTKGEIKLSGDRELLMRVGFVKGEKGAGRDETALVFDKKYFSTYTGKNGAAEQDGSLSVREDGKQAAIKGTLWQEYQLPLETAASRDTVLELAVNHVKQAAAEEEKFPYRVEIGPDEKVVIKGIELKGYNVTRVRPPEQVRKRVFDTVLGIGVVSGTGAARVEKIYPFDGDSKGKREIPVGRDFDGKKISRVILYCNEGTAEFSDGKIFTPRKGEGILDPKNEIAKALDAKVKVDGIEVTRDRNSEISDIIKGVNLNLKQAADRDVEIRVDANIDKSIDDIRKFVQAYNNYLEYHKELIKTEKIEKPGDNDRKKKTQNGLFVGDMTVIRLENQVKQTVNSAYNSRAEKPVKMFSQMGVSTGEVNSSWENIKQGKLVIDEAKLRTQIQENPEGVEQFFAADTDGDSRMDTGMAFSLSRELKAYIGFGKNIIASKIDYENDNIKNTDERIERQKIHLAQYEDKLRKKFAAMEKTISGAKAQQNWMKNQMGGGQTGDK